MMRKIFITIALIFPIAAFAAITLDNSGNLNSSLVKYTKTPQTVGDIFQGFSEGNLAGLVPTIVAVGLVTFLAGVVGFIRAGDDAEKRASGHKVMVFGIVVLFVMISYWGFVGFFTRSFLGEEPAIPNYLPPLQTR